jgi:RimJ/RimL family protein N-acetyltransferase
VKLNQQKEKRQRPNKLENTKTILKTRRLYLTQWSKADKDALLAILGDENVARFIADGRPFNEKQVDDFLEWAEVYERENGYSRWKIVEIATGETVGSCGFARPKESPEIELGYLFAEKHWNRGFASEITAATVEYGFKKLRFDEIIAHIALENTASQRVLEKIGFHKRGVENINGEVNLVYVRNKSDG